MKERVQKILSQWGIASRRQAETMILAGRVRLNGCVVQLGQKANPQVDLLEVDGQPVELCKRPELIYLLLNKPTGVVSTCRDPRNRPTVLDLLPRELQHAKGLHPVGRLDADSTGALLVTNDGTLTFHLTHPRHHITKIYQVWVEGHPSPEVLQQWRQGVILHGKKTLPAGVRVLKRRPKKTLLEIALTEGRNRQIRRVAELLNYRVIHLHRTAIGPIQLQQSGEPALPSGHYRPLKASEIRFLHQSRDEAGVLQGVNSRDSASGVKSASSCWTSSVPNVHGAAKHQANAPYTPKKNSAQAPADTKEYRL